MSVKKAAVYFMSRLARVSMAIILAMALLVTMAITATHTRAAGGPIGAWKLDEGSGTTVADTSGNGNNGTIVRGTGTGSPAWVSPGHDAGTPFALDFDGSGTQGSASNTVNLGNAAILDQMDNYTISLWVKFKPGYVGSGGTWANLVGRNSSGANWAWMIYVNNTGHIRPHHRNSNGTFAPLTNSVAPMPVDEWVHIEQVADGGQLHLYINGVEDPNFPIAYSGTTMSLPSANTYIGQDTRERAPLATISDVKIYNDAIVAPQVSTDAATDITQTSATLNGTLDDLGDFTAANVFFRYRVSGSSDPYTETVPQSVGATGPFSAGISGLTPGTEYEFEAIVQWAGRDGTQHATGATNTFDTPTAPTAPAPVVNLQAMPEGTDQINLLWGAPTSNGSPITGYKIERSLDGINWSVVIANTVSTDTTFTDTGRTPNTEYFYRVFAINAIGAAASSNTANATTDQLIPPTPSDNTGTAGGASSTGGKLASTGQNIALIVGVAVLLVGVGVVMLSKNKSISIRKKHGNI
jgi:hypothetical protein